MGKYKVVFRSDLTHQDDDFGLDWEPGCQLMFTAIQISRNTETGEAYLQSKVENIGTSEILSFKAEFTCRYQDGEAEEFKLEMLDADIHAGGELALKPILLSKGDAVGAQAVVSCLKTETGEWESKSDVRPYPDRVKLELSDKAVEERRRQLREEGCLKPDEAKEHHFEDNGEWVQCPCGKITMGMSRCPSCGFDLEGSSVPEDETALCEAADSRAAAEQKRREEEAARKEKEAALKKERIERLKAKAASVAPKAAVALVVLVVLLFFGGKELKYADAVDAYEAGSYRKASRIFQELEGYRDSEDLREKCRAAIEEMEQLSLAEERLSSGDVYGAIDALASIEGSQAADEMLEELEGMLPSSVFDVTSFLGLSEEAFESYLIEEVDAECTDEWGRWTSDGPEGEFRCHYEYLIAYESVQDLLPSELRPSKAIDLVFSVTTVDDIVSYAHLEIPLRSKWVAKNEGEAARMAGELAGFQNLVEEKGWFEPGEIAGADGYDDGSCFEESDGEGSVCILVKEKDEARYGTIWLSAYDSGE